MEKHMSSQTPAYRTKQSFINYRKLKQNVYRQFISNCPNIDN